MNIVDCCLRGEDVWINPVGGMGDVLIASSVMKLVHEQWPQVRFKVVKRNRFTQFFTGHPAVQLIGHPPLGARIFGTLYWQDEDFFGQDFFTELRPFQIIAKKFGLSLPAPERLFYPQKDGTDVSLLGRYFAEDGKTVIISVSSDCPRKQMSPILWGQIIDALQKEGVTCLLVGKDGDPYIPGCVSLLGLTTPDQLFELISKVDAVVTADNFITHLAKAAGTKAVVVWGPTTKEMYGYEGHVHIDAPRGCEDMDKCIGNTSPYGYRDECTKGIDEKCMNQISAYTVLDAVKRILG